MKIAIATDHGGFHLKKSIVEFLRKEQITVEDFGPMSAERVDYPDFAFKVVESVSSGEAQGGILICGTGLGMAIAANKARGIRAVTVDHVYAAQMAKEHNNANVITFGGRMLDAPKAVRLVKAWLRAKFQGARHQLRLNKISEKEISSLVI